MDNSEPWRFEVWTDGTIYREDTREGADYIVAQCREDGTPFCLIERTKPFWDDDSEYTVLSGDESVITQGGD